MVATATTKRTPPAASAPSASRAITPITIVAANIATLVTMK